MAESRVTNLAVLVEYGPPEPKARVTNLAVLVEYGALPAVPPHGMRAAKNVAVVIGGTDITQWVTGARNAGQVDLLDDTRTGDQATRAVPTPQAWVLELEGIWDPALDAILGPMAIAPPYPPPDVTATFGADYATVFGSGPVTYTWSACWVADYTIDGPARAGARWSARLVCLGRPTRT